MKLGRVSGLDPSAHYAVRAGAWSGVMSGADVTATYGRNVSNVTVTPTTAPVTLVLDIAADARAWARGELS